MWYMHLLYNIIYYPEDMEPSTKVVSVLSLTVSAGLRYAIYPESVTQIKKT